MRHFGGFKLSSGLPKPLAVRFFSKLSVVEEEADESAFWLEIIIECSLIQKELVEPLLREANEIVAIMVSAKKTSRSNRLTQTIS